MAKYSATDKLLHRMYLGNYSLSKAAFEIEEILHGRKAAGSHISEYIFVTGLARSGTTAVMRKIFQTGQYASLQYSNMPFLLNPNSWNRKSRIGTHERAHKDGILIDGNSPEEFDEFFWKVHLKDSYIEKEGLVPHNAGEELLGKYEQYIRLICLAKGKSRYVSKNNNNILRLPVLRRLPNSRIIFLFREPVSHASSLMKLHKRFSEEQEQDSFALEYFDFLGHHEFGLHHKPFMLSTLADHAINEFSTDDINYWILIWLNYYQFLLENLHEDDVLICFEDLMSNPDDVYGKLSLLLLNRPNFEKAKEFKSKTKAEDNVQESLLRRSKALYAQLLELKL